MASVAYFDPGESTGRREGNEGGGGKSPRKEAQKRLRCWERERRWRKSSLDGGEVGLASTTHHQRVDFIGSNGRDEQE